jgi:hypothetical protein
MKLQNHSTLRRRLLPVASAALAIVAGAVLTSGGVAATKKPVASPTGGPIAILATLGPNPNSKILVAGAIGDWGTALSIDRNGKPDENGNYVKVTLKNGTFVLDSTALNKKTASPHPQVSSDNTCSISFTGSAPVTLLHGTGRYKGISGAIDATLTFTGVGGRYQTGAKKGQCERGNGKPLAMLGAVTGRGTVHFR